MKWRVTAGIATASQQAAKPYQRMQITFVAKPVTQRKPIHEITRNNTKVMITRTKQLFLIVLLVVMSGCSSFRKAPPDATADNLSLSSGHAPLPLEARRARIAFAYEPLKTIRAGERTSVHLLVTNLGSVVWPYSGDRGGKYEIRVGNHWIDRNGNFKDDGRGSLPYDLHPGDTAEILIVINAPQTTGEYTLEFDMVQEQVGWFGDSGSEKLRLNVAIG